MRCDERRRVAADGHSTRNAVRASKEIRTRPHCPVRHKLNGSSVGTPGKSATLRVTTVSVDPHQPIDPPPTSAPPRLRASSPRNGETMDSVCKGNSNLLSITSRYAMGSIRTVCWTAPSNPRMTISSREASAVPSIHVAPSGFGPPPTNCP